MPGKVNPVIPEMVMQCAMKVMADDSAIAMAAAHGEFELNAFEPLIADCLLESLQLLIRSVRIFQTACVEGWKSGKTRAGSTSRLRLPLAQPISGPWDMIR